MTSGGAEQHNEPVAAASAAIRPAPLAVLDTNAALDVLAFQDKRANALIKALQTKQLSWLASAYMRQELEFVLPRPGLLRYGFDSSAILSAFDAATLRVEPAATQALMSCRDDADQPFINLALAAGARWLVTSDRDLLVLAKRAKRLGLLILTPQTWPGTESER